MRKRPELNCETCPGRMKSIFCGLKGDELNQLNSNKNVNVYKKGQNLFLEGNPAYGLFCLHSGKVKVTKSDSQGRETIVKLVQKGGVIGHRSLFSKSPYAASATVIEDGMICFVSKETVNSIIQQSPSLALEIIDRLSQEMGASEEKLASMARKNVRERFAEMLLILKENFGKSLEGNETLLNIKLTREEMGQIVGAAPENIIRLVTEFKSLGLIRVEKKDIVLVDVPGIEEEASLGV